MTHSLHDRLPETPLHFIASSLSVERARVGDAMQKEYWLKHNEHANLRFLYAVFVLKLYEHERDLNAGRFACFRDTPMPWSVSIFHENHDTPWWVKCEPMVGWIAENTDSAWNLTVSMNNVFEGNFIFSFEDPCTATFFKLAFA